MSLTWASVSSRPSIASSKRNAAARSVKTFAIDSRRSDELNEITYMAKIDKHLKIQQLREMGPQRQCAHDRNEVDGQNRGLCNQERRGGALGAKRWDQGEG